MTERLGFDLSLSPTFTMASQDDDRAGSGSDSVDQAPVRAKKRRLHGACDACRKKKGGSVSLIRCNTELRSLYLQ